MTKDMTKDMTVIPCGQRWNGPDEEGHYTRWFVPYAAQAAVHWAFRFPYEPCGGCVFGCRECSGAWG